MIILGITGSVGMGKTEAGKYFIKNNIDVFDCDKEIATFYNKKDTIFEIKKNFPSTIHNNKVDKNALANIVFNDKSKLKLLEELLHKKLQKEQSFWLRKKIREKKNLLVFDVPLLFEKDNIKKYDFVMVLSCNKALQRIRVLKRQGWNEERYEKTLKEQIPDYTKQTLADIIIKSDRGKRYLNQEIIKIIKEVKNKKNRKIHEILKEF
ncbi:MAG: dephospho-CoA kinase [Alphaproteobacteria bacterium]|nr:MAG: dephospho-CoA kinase [Alphaproteobacteria bacterium]